jgi:hypothetical protein
MVAALVVGLPVSVVEATDVFWDGGAGTTAWGTSSATPNNNWADTGAGQYTPSAQFGERAVLGTDDPAPGQLAAVSTITASPPNVGGIVFGLRETNSFGELVNPEPAAGTLTGQLTISGGTVNAINTSQSAAGADGRVLVGVQGRGYLTMTGGTLNTRQLVVAGEQNTSGLGNSTLDLSGNATLSVSNAHQAAPNNVPDAAYNYTTLSRNLKITGPSVNFNTFGRLTLNPTNEYTAVITSSTVHSALKTNNIAVVGGTLNVQFSGAGATHTIGERWDLVDAAIDIAGNFSNLGEGGSIGVSGLAGAVPLGAAYRVEKVEEGGRTKLQLAYDRVLVLQVNRDTGQMTVRSPQGGSIGITGYTVKSTLGSLVTTYSGISGTLPTPPNAGWSKPTTSGGQPLNTANVLTEVKAPDFTPPINDLDFGITSSAVSLGNGFSRTAVGNNPANFGTPGEDLVFEYETLNGFVVGQIEYVGTKFENNMVLRVNPTTGQAFLKNDSLETLKFDGYSITSTTGSLVGGTWTGLSSASGWQKSPATANALSQSNPTSSSTLAPGAQLALGDIGAFTTQAAQDGLELKFILSEALEGEGSGNLAGDFNSDGTVDGRDFLVWQRNTSVGSLADWKANYGQSGGGSNPPETTYRIGTIVFDNSAGVAAIAAVPEPTTAALLAGVIGGLAFVRRNRNCPSRTVASVRTINQQGAATMSRRVMGLATMLATLCGFLGMADRALAATQAIPLTNGNFELPGPEGTKVVAFGETGIPFAPSPVIAPTALSSGQLAGSIPGWTFTGGNGGAGEEACPGLGCETFGDGLPGDSGTEGKGAGLAGNEMILSTVDGKAYQTSSFSLPASALPAAQKVLLTFEAVEIYTPVGEAQLTARLYYVDGGGNRQIIGSPLVVGSTETPLAERATHTLEFVGGSAALTPALGRPIGVSFDTTSLEFDATATQSWVGVDDVLLEIAGTLPGDFNGDGAINLTDYGIIRDNLETAKDYLYQGDIVRDGYVDLNDFRAWKNLPSVISSGVLAQIAAIPEPSSLVLVLGTVALVGGMRRKRMSRALVTCFVFALALSMASSSQAAVLYYDPFNTGASPASGQYSVAPLVPSVGAGQNPTVGPTPFFTGAWEMASADVNGTKVQAQGLSFLGSPASGGSLAVSLDANNVPVSSRAGRRLSTPFTTTTVGTYYMSFLTSFGGVGVSPTSTNRDDVAHRAIEMWTDTGSVGNDANLAFRVGYMSYNGNFNSLPPSEAPLKAGPTGNTEVVIQGGPSSFLADNGATHLIVLKFTMSDQNLADSIELFLDPTENDEPVIANASWFNINFTLGSVSGPVQFGGAGTPMVFDELRVADTYIDALPDFPMKGDTNNDDLVNMADYTNIYQHLNLTGANVPNELNLHPDVNGDGRVDLRDVALWRSHRTDVGVLNAGVTVPEPASVVLGLLASLGVWGMGRRR